MGEAYLNQPLSLLASSVPKTYGFTANDTYYYDNKWAEDANPRVGTQFSLPFVPSKAVITFSRLDTIGRETTQYLTINTPYTIANGNFLNIAYFTRTQGSTTYRLYYRVRLTGSILQYEISWNKWNHIITGATDAYCEVSK